MKLYLSIGPDRIIYLQARAEGEGGGVGDLFEEVLPGDPRYSQLLALGEGSHDMARVGELLANNGA